MSLGGGGVGKVGYKEWKREQGCVRGCHASAGGEEKRCTIDEF